jgi:hypothetical protein
MGANWEAESGKTSLRVCLSDCLILMSVSSFIGRAKNAQRHRRTTSCHGRVP